MDNDKTDIFNFLQEKEEFYSFMSMVFMDSPSNAFCTTLWGMLNDDYFPLADNNIELHALCVSLREKLRETNLEEFIQALSQEYYNLFFEPGGINVSPWQSSYTNKEQLLFQETDGQAKAMYRRYGYKVEDNHLPGDHIAIELDFLSKLSSRELKNIDSVIQGGNKQLLSDIQNFICKHILSWIDEFIDSLKDNASVYYLLFASMVKIVCEEDKAFMPNL